MMSLRGDGFVSARHSRRAYLYACSTVKRFRAHKRCAALPWATLEGALNNQQDVVTVR